MDRREPSLIPTAVLLGVLAAMLLAVGPGARLLERLPMDANAADWIQAFAGVAQLIVAVVLIGFTAVTLKANQKSADAAAASAEATRAAVDESIRSREQSRQHFVQDASPIVAFQLFQALGSRDLKADEFDIEVRNLGRGPALDVSFRIEAVPKPYAVRLRKSLNTHSNLHIQRVQTEADFIQPVTLGAGESIRLRCFTADASTTEVVGEVIAEYRGSFGGELRSSAHIRHRRVDRNMGAIGLELQPLRFERQRQT